MFFRNELKETMEALYLTQRLEKALENDGASGFSLMDKIKSYQTKEKHQFEHDYEFRAYRRSLLDGRYNDLRGLVRERNNIMHQSGYLVPDFLRFKYRAKDAIEYFENNRQNPLTFQQLLFLVVSFVPYLFVFTVVFFLFSDSLSQSLSFFFPHTSDIFTIGVPAIIIVGLLFLRNKTEILLFYAFLAPIPYYLINPNYFADYVVKIIMLNAFLIILLFIFQALTTIGGHLLSIYITKIYETYRILQAYMMNSRLIIVLLLISYTFWGQDITYLNTLIEKSQTLASNYSYNQE